MHDIMQLSRTLLAHSCIGPKQLARAQWCSHYMHTISTHSLHEKSLKTGSTTTLEPVSGRRSLQGDLLCMPCVYAGRAGKMPIHK